jgi:hypothetical protein
MKLNIYRLNESKTLKTGTPVPNKKKLFAVLSEIAQSSN